MLFFWIVFLCATGIDRGVKYREMATMTPGRSLVIVPRLLNFTYVRNTGVGFGMFAGISWLPLTVSALTLCAVIYIWYRIRPMPLMLAGAFGLLCAGTVGNSFDRLAHGFVIDIFELAFISFPVFNVADLCINVGCALLVVWILFSSRLYFEKYS